MRSGERGDRAVSFVLQVCSHCDALVTAYAGGDFASEVSHDHDHVTHADLSQKSELPGQYCLATDRQEAFRLVGSNGAEA